jgi:hypothetical protein
MNVRIEGKNSTGLLSSERRCGPATDVPNRDLPNADDYANFDA